MPMHVLSLTPLTPACGILHLMLCADAASQIGKWRMTAPSGLRSPLVRPAMRGHTQPGAPLAAPPPIRSPYLSAASRWAPNGRPPQGGCTPQRGCLPQRGCPPQSGCVAPAASLASAGCTALAGSVARAGSVAKTGRAVFTGSPLVGGSRAVPPFATRSGPTWAAVERVAASGLRATVAASALARTVAAARAPSTLSKYSNWLRQFEVFCSSTCAEAQSWPAAPAVVALWVASLAGRRLAPSTIEGAVAALAAAHRFAGELDPTTDPVVRLAMDGAMRSNARPVVQAGALSPAHVVRLITHLSASPELKHWRLAAMLGFAFGGVARLDDIAHLSLADVSADGSGGLRVHVRRSKTDQMAAGFYKTVAPAPLGSPVCPVRAFMRYRDGLTRSSPIPPVALTSLPLWPNLTGGVSPRALWSSGGLSKDAARKQLAAALLACGLDQESYTWHSCRSGAATAAARAGAAPLTLQALGGWKSDAYKVYVRRDEAELRAASSAVWAVRPTSLTSLTSPAPCTAAALPACPQVQQRASVKRSAVASKPTPPARRRITAAPAPAARASPRRTRSATHAVVRPPIRYVES